jgi:succinate dehydrogenase/fumarate reductase flavoprotein subunit
LVFGARAGQAMKKDSRVKKRSAAAMPGGVAPKPDVVPNTPAAKTVANHPLAFAKIRELMWRQVGVMRNGKDLAGAVEQLGALELPKSEKPGRAERELRHLKELALLTAKSALARLESRGSHYRSDFPYRDDDDFAKHSIAQKGKDVRFED